MSNRIVSPATQSPFGLVAWLEQTKVRLPLKGVECRFHVCGDLLNVEVDQIFHQDSAQPMDCLYTFPLPAGAAVYRCEMHVNGRCIRARVEEQERAREIAREHRAAGRRTVLVEMERDNLFTLSLGNVQPGDLVVIRFGYFQTITRLADWTSLRIPFCPGVRYIPGKPLLRKLRGRGIEDDTDQVPDASRISPPRLDALHPDAAYLVVEGEVEHVTGGLKDLSSPSHPVLVRDGDQRFHVSLADQSAVPDCDFVLRWTETPREDVGVAGWVAEGESTAFALVRLHGPRLTQPVEESGQDFYFLLDQSGSMNGLKWAKALEAFRRFLDLLGTRDRAWLTLFNQTHTDFAERPFTAAEWKADGGLARMDELRADGGTELLPALRHVLGAQAKHSSDRAAALVLITDGEIGNEAAVLEALRPYPGLCVHTFGIDTTVNDALLARLAEQQRGSCCLLTPTDDIVGAVTRVSTRLHPPVLTGISVQGGWELPGDVPLGVHSEEVVLLSLKGKAGATDLTVRARGADGAERIFQVSLAPRSEPALRLLWAKRHVDQCVRRGEKSKAIALATHYNVLCEGAAFVAWDESEKVNVAMREVYQPSYEPRCLVSGLMYEDIDEGREFLGDARDVSLESGLFGDAPIAATPASPPGLLRRILGKAFRPRRRVGYELELMLPGLTPAAREAMLRQGVPKWMAGWYVSMTEAAVAAKFPMDTQFLELFFHWLGDEATEVEARRAKLEALLNRLEQSAPDPGAWLKAMRDWGATEMASAPARLKELLNLLDRCADKLP